MLFPFRTTILGLLISTLLHCAISIVPPILRIPLSTTDASPSCPLLIAGELSTPVATCPLDLSDFLKLSPVAFQS